ncbi:MULTISPECIES: DEAD/DEAH box helicase [Shewanella]|uniref:DEAD/DEAH box helicase n=1 Tax=Shewanella TaxID=22 RepID=UPI001CF56BE9|nr:MULTISPECIES: AAA domain-containing protein [Shewanella]MCB2381383.1 AAA domain-containing protein [Shewanella sp. SR1]MCS6098775.1 AAA family ATPase [Shewanella baltica]MCS6185388.1 AAA family ATPase [Shewanella baltica]
MPFPLFAVAGAVMLTASAVAWYFNQKTDEEKHRQGRAYQERDNIRSRFESAAEQESSYFTEEQIKQAERDKTLLLAEIEKLSEKITPISESLSELYKIIQSEIAAETTSPYRRSALLREYARIQDAQKRLIEYRKYLEFEKKQIINYWQQQKYGQLIDLDLADALLPLEWLYEGKLVLAELSDIGRQQPKFEHRLLFNGNREQQQALAIGYGDDFPILVVREGNKKDGAFFGCVAKGLCFHDHIRSNTPAYMVVERYLAKDKSYLGTLFDGLIKVQLPEMALLHPSLKCISGQKLPVFFDSFDSTLSCNPAGKPNQRGRMPLPTVSAKPPAFLGQDHLELYIEVEEQQLECITDELFYSEQSQWTLIGHDFETNEVVLGKASVQLSCVPTATSDGLSVIKASQHKTTQIGVDLPFDFILASKEIEPNKYFSWSYGLEQLYTFVSQALIDKNSTQERLQQVEFFKRWQRVVDYQRKVESERTVEFDVTPELVENSSYILRISKESIQQAYIDESSVTSFIKDIEMDEYLSLNRSFRLQIWDEERGGYLPAIDRNKIYDSEISVTPEQSVEIRATLFKFNNINLEQKQKFKFSISKPNSALQRQQQALDALFEDRLVELRLKDIFLSPSSYKPEYIAHWKNKDIEWRDSLRPSQQEVVKTALSAKHIAMIQGPPGTGKTTTIVEMLYQLISHNPHQRILVVSQQNTAVDNAIIKFKKKYPELIADGVNIVRIGNPGKLDDEIKEDHFGRLYDEFLSNKLDTISSKVHLLEDTVRNATYEWAALLKEMQAKSSSNKVSDEFFTTMLADKNLIGATCVGLAARKAGLDHLEFDVVIVDEAGRATVPELLIPLLRSKKAILIGDHHQLPPSISPVLRDDSAKEELEFLKETFLESSFFEVLFEQLPNDCTASLQEQFRMASPIGDLVAELFYTTNGERRLFNGAVDASNTSDFVHPACLIWQDVRGEQNRPHNSTSIENHDEAIAIRDFLRQIAGKQKVPIDVAVITPYGAQKRKIRQLLTKDGESQNLIHLGNLKIKVDTVDSFQGSEAELVCYSTVRTYGALQFLLDRKRLNVACSRAKQNLVFFGHSQFLKNWNPNNGEINLFSEILKRTKLISIDINTRKKI